MHSVAVNNPSGGDDGPVRMLANSFGNHTFDRSAYSRVVFLESSWYQTLRDLKSALHDNFPYDKLKG